jgi:hypothetical protein
MSVCTNWFPHRPIRNQTHSLCPSEQVPHKGLDEYAILGGLMNQGLRPPTPATPPPHPCWQGLMEGCWEEKAAGRPTFAVVLEMLESWREELSAQQ